jgi:hypothetical protein
MDGLASSSFSQPNNDRPSSPPLNFPTKNSQTDRRCSAGPTKRSNVDDIQPAAKRCFETPNPFAALADADEMTTEQVLNENVQTRPPPIMVQNVAKYDAVRSALLNLIGNNFNCTISSKCVTIRTNSPSDYRKVISYLKESSAEYHTYQLPDDKAYRVVIRGLHPSTPTELIKSEIEEQFDHKVRSITNVISRLKVPTPLFFVDLEQNPNNIDIFKISSLINCKVKVEEPRIRHEIPQCARCQSFSHTKAYCFRQPRCVRCGGNHISSDCTKSRDIPATCANCGNSHPANYRGCTVYQDLRRQRQRQQVRVVDRPTQKNKTITLEDNRAFPPLPNKYVSNNVWQRTYEQKSTTQPQLVQPLTSPRDPRLYGSQQFQQQQQQDTQTKQQEQHYRQQQSQQQHSNQHERSPLQHPPSTNYDHSQHTPHTPLMNGSDLRPLIDCLVAEVQKILQPMMSVLSQLSQTLLVLNNNYNGYK